MTKRALVIGSQTGDLVGVDADAAVMAETLTAFGFVPDLRTGANASRAGILDGYRSLIAASEPDDAAVVYYAGHGNRQFNALAQQDPSLPSWIQYLVPTDIDDRSDGRFQGILAEELRLLQRQLTDATPNVTTILDCCHSARMSRGIVARPRADETIVPFPWDAIRGRWQEVREAEIDRNGRDSNPLAVRLVGCAPEQSAYELAETSIGGPHGALTATLAALLRSDAAPALTWQEVIDIVRPGVLEQASPQRPELEGDRTRVLFSVETRSDAGSRTVALHGDTAVIEHASLFGVAVGDRYELVAPGRAETDPVPVVVDRLVGDDAVLRLERPEPIVPGSVARPVAVALGRRPVRLIGAGDELTERLGASVQVRIADGDEPVMATVAVVGDDITVRDAAGDALFDPVPMGASTATEIEQVLDRLARATHLRNLASGTGPERLPADVATEVRLVDDDGERVLASGEHVFVGDRIVIRLTSTATEARFGHVLDIGLAGAITVVNSSEPDGIVLTTNEQIELGRSPGTTGDGFPLEWPKAVPDDGPRVETLIAIASDTRLTGLTRLEQGSAVATRGAGSRLDLLLGAVATGRRDLALPAASTVTRYRVQRFDLVLHPTPRPAVARRGPAFEVDARPDPSFRVTPRARAAAEVTRIELGVHGVSGLPAGHRVEGIAVTAADRGCAVHHLGEAPTMLTARDFVDVALWIVPDAAPSLRNVLADVASTSDDAASTVIARADAALRGAGGSGWFRDTLLAGRGFSAGPPGAPTHRPVAGSTSATITVGLAP